MRYLIVPLFVLVSLLTQILQLGAPCQADEPAERWWKGNLHTHTLWSDGNDFPEMIADWYYEHDYNFLALSDHNVLSEGMRWMRLKSIKQRGGSKALEEYTERFGAGWVETRGSGDSLEVRLKPFSEYRALVEERDRFLMIPSEEISDRSQGKPVHMNATNLAEVLQPLGGATVREAMQNNLRAAEEQAKKRGREIMVHLNHPNFGWAITAEDLAHVLSEQFFEVYNGHPGVNHLGNKDHDSVERIWDVANTIRLHSLKGSALLGIATDDSHNYHGRPGSRPGRGWVMVRSRYLTPEHIIKAMKRGDFYASSGVVLEDVQYASERLSLHIRGQENATYTTTFIGTRKPSQPSGENEEPAKIPLPEVGKVLATATGLNPSYQLKGDELYVRAVVTSSLPAVDPSHKGQMQQAWTQPVGWQ